MMLLSEAIKRGSGDPFEAAYRALVPYSPFMSEDSRCRERIEKLHEEWPQLGLTVRTWPVLARRLEVLKLLPEPRKYQARYRQEIHLSLWGAIAALHDTATMSTPEIRVLLDEVGL
jgi:hypothetical protein